MVAIGFPLQRASKLKYFHAMTSSWVWVNHLSGLHFDTNTSPCGQINYTWTEINADISVSGQEYLGYESDKAIYYQLIWYSMSQKICTVKLCFV